MKVETLLAHFPFYAFRDSVVAAGLAVTVTFETSQRNLQLGCQTVLGSRHRGNMIYN